MHRIATVCFISAAIAAFVSACSSSDSPTTGGTAGAASGAAGGGATLTGNATKGLTLYSQSPYPGCSGCHGTHGEGAQGPNITANTTAGIGGWTEAQFHDAVRSSKNRKGTALCQFMVALDSTQASDQDIADLYAYLMTQNEAGAQAGSYCTMGGSFCTCVGTQ